MEYLIIRKKIPVKKTFILSDFVMLTALNTFFLSLLFAYSFPLYSQDLGDGFSECKTTNTAPVGYDCPSPQPQLSNGAIQGTDNEWSVFVGGDFNVILGSEAEGRVFVLGDVNVNKIGAYNIGIAGAGSRVIPENGQNFLEVGGNVNVANGANIIIGGATGDNNYPNLVASGDLTLNGSVNLTGTGQITDANAVNENASINLTNALSELVALQSISSDLAQWPTSANASTTIEISATRFISSDGAPGTYIFNYNQDIDNGSGGFTSIYFDNFPDDATIIINMLGTTVNINAWDMKDSSGNFNFNFSPKFRGKILWNFPNATQINLTGTGLFEGSILAPFTYTNLLMSMESQNGRLIVGGNLTQGHAGSFHNYAFTGDLTLTVPNASPVATAQNIETNEATSVTLTLIGSDSDGSITNYNIVNPTHGTLTGTAPNLIYTPNANYFGSDSFTFTVTDNDGSHSTQATVSIAIFNVNETPTGTAQSISTSENTSIAVTLTGSDNDGSIASYSVTDPVQGTLTGTAPSLTYTPNTNYFGSDSFTFTVTDNDGMESTASAVSITILEASNSNITPALLDFDGDGISDIEEGDADSDGDGILDYKDTDSDNDGIDDSVEGLADTDEDGIPNYLDSSIDEDADGIPDIIEGTDDIDNDGLANYLDTDSDNDGISDSIEAKVTFNDTDGDGIDDAFDVDYLSETDANADGIVDKLNLGGGDTDSDGVLDYLDRDSDNDGLSDAFENNNLTGLGIDEDFTVIDTDLDGLIDSLDMDADNDGIPDIQEQISVALMGIDTDSDGIDDAFDVDNTGGIDRNSDGIDDEILMNNDADNDGILNFRDLDSDGDGIPDAIEGLVDSDADGLANYIEIDSDNDGILDSNENGDYNNDGINDRLQYDGKIVTSASGAGSINIVLLLGLIALFTMRNSANLLRLVLIALGIVSISVNAKETCPLANSKVQNSCWYIGGGIGMAYLSPDHRETSWRIDDEVDTAIKILTGFNITEYWFTEISYEDMGNATLLSLNPAITKQLKIDYTALEVSVGHWLFEDKSLWNVYAKAGLTYLQTSTNEYIEQEETTRATIGAGVQYRFTAHWFARININAYSTDAQALGFTLGYFLGGTTNNELKRPI